MAGKSSGGYGAMVVPMLRPDVFGALASHAGDALFEYCYLPEFPAIARLLRDDFGGSFDELLSKMRSAPAFDWGRFGDAFSMYAYACAYTPDPDRPGKPLLPFDPATGRLDDDVWQRWLALDPVRMAEPTPTPCAACAGSTSTPGRQDEFFLDLGAQAFSDELTRLDIDHTLELFDGKHGGISYRYPGAIRELVLVAPRAVTATAHTDLAFAGPGALAAMVRAGSVRRASWSSSTCAGSRRSTPSSTRSGCCAPSRRWPRPTPWTAPVRWPGCRSRSRTTSTWPARSPRGARAASGPRRPPTPSRSAGCAPPARSRSASPMSPSS